MFWWRVTKYNPLNRNDDGSYINDEEWTSYSDISSKVNKEDYLKIEQSYINAIITFMDEMGLNNVYLNALEQWSDEIENQNASQFLLKMWLGKSVNTQEVKDLARLTLREAIWCRLTYKNEFYVHFGYDYYMYIGANKDCPNARQKVEATGLYVEECNSPYLN